MPREISSTLLHLFFRNNREVSLEEKIKNAYYSKDKLPYHAHDLFVSAWITAIITILLTPSLGKRSDLHNTLRVDTPKEVGVYDYTTSTDTSLPSPRLVSLQHYNDFISFKEKMGYRESRNNYFITNPYGHIGKYQFGKSALKFFGVSRSDFLNNPSLQENVFYTSLAHNKWKLQHEINTFAGKNFAGVYVTESGILAAAHLLGANSVKSFFKSKGKNVLADANGTTITNYHEELSELRPILCES